MNRTALVWKYFFQQKWDEIYDYFEEWWCAYFVISITFATLFQIGWVGTQEYSSDVYKPLFPFLGKIGLIILTFWTLVGIIIVLRITLEWLRDNWKEANKKADKEIRKLKKQKGKQ